MEENANGSLEFNISNGRVCTEVPWKRHGNLNSCATTNLTKLI